MSCDRREQNNEDSLQNHVFSFYISHIDILPPSSLYSALLCSVVTVGAAVVTAVRVIVVIVVTVVTATFFLSAAVVIIAIYSVAVVDVVASCCPTFQAKQLLTQVCQVVRQIAWSKCHFAVRWCRGFHRVF